MNKLCDDTNNLILSFIIDKPELNNKKQYLNNDILFLYHTSNYWNKLIKLYIERIYPDIPVYFNLNINNAMLKTRSRRNI